MTGKKEKAAAAWARVCYGACLRDGKPVMVRAVRSGAGVDVVALAEKDRSFTIEVNAGKAIVAGCLGERESFTRWLTAPFSSKTKTQDVLPSLLDIQLPFPLEDCVYGFSPAESKDSGGTRALAAIARSGSVRKALAAYAAAGIDPVTLDQEGLALWTQSQRERPIGPGTTRVVVNLLGEHATAAIGNDGGFLSSHALRATAKELDRILHARMDTRPAAMEWAWCGPGAKDAGVVESLLSSLRTSRPGDSFIHDDPDMLLPRGVATRALLAGPFRCNLRAGDFEHPSITSRARKRVRNLAYAFLAAGLLLCAGNYTAGRIYEHRLDNAIRAVGQEADSVAGWNVTAGGHKGSNAVEKAEAAVSERLKGMRPFADAFEPSLLPVLKTVIDAGAEHELSYRTVSLESDAVRISGTGSDWDRCERLLEALRETGANVELGSRERSGDGTILFSIKPGADK